MDLEFLTSIVTQLPLVALFAWFVIRRDKDFQALLKARDQEWQEFFLEIQSAQKNVCATHQKTLVSTSVSLEKMASQIAKNTVSMMLHDATVRGVNPDTMGSHEDLLEKVIKGS